MGHFDKIECDQNYIDNIAYVTALKDIKLKWASLTKKTLEYDFPRQMIYTHMNPQIQIGPTCGLVVLSMISSITSVPKSVEEIMKISVESGFTKQGEMFSAENFYSLAYSLLQTEYTIKHYIGGLGQRKEEIIQDLFNETLILLPYDADRNHSPGCFKGHKAHWAVVCGIIIDDNNQYLIARQGKSKHVGVWLFDDMDKSNLNLMEISPNRASEEDGYIFHNIKETLSGHYISLMRKVVN